MKTFMRNIICIFVLTICNITLISSCGSSKMEDTDKNNALILGYEGLTNGDYQKAIDSFTEYNTLVDEINSAVEIGLGKAFFGTADYKNAIIHFQNAYNIDPDNNTLHYIGEAQILDENYLEARNTLLEVYKYDQGNEYIINKIKLCYNNEKDYMSQYEFNKQVYDYFSEQNTSDEKYYIKNDYLMELLCIALESKDESLINSAVEVFENNGNGELAELIISANSTLQSGNEEELKEILIDISNVENFFVNNKCFLKENNNGESENYGFIIYPTNDDIYLTFYIGEIADNTPQGKGSGYNTYNSTNSSDDRITYKVTWKFIGVWEKGNPVGTFEEEYFREVYKDGISFDTYSYVNTNEY